MVSPLVDGLVVDVVLVDPMDARYPRGRSALWGDRVDEVRGANGAPTSASGGSVPDLGAWSTRWSIPDCWSITEAHSAQARAHAREGHARSRINQNGFDLRKQCPNQPLVDSGIDQQDWSIIGRFAPRIAGRFPGAPATTSNTGSWPLHRLPGDPRTPPRSHSKLTLPVAPVRHGGRPGAGLGSLPSAARREHTRRRAAFPSPRRVVKDAPSGHAEPRRRPAPLANVTTPRKPQHQPVDRGCHTP